MRPKLMVSRRWPAEVEKRLADNWDVRFNESDKPMNTAQFRDALQNCDALLPTVTDKLGAEVFALQTCKGVRTKIIANYGVGYSHIDIDSARANDIVVTNTPDVLSECTADIAMALMLMVARRAGEGERELRAGGWSGWRPTHMVGTRVSGSTLGIVGFGRIGRETAKRALGFGMQILVHNRSAVDPVVLEAHGARQVGSIEELLKGSDFVSLHCPGGAENADLINRERLGLMKPTAFLINTARGEVIEEDALLDALETRQIGGAGLDVFPDEPAINPRYIGLENAVLLPHLGSATVETRNAMGFRVIHNLEQFFAGEEPDDRVA